MTYALQILTAFLGSLGFSVLFNLRRTKLLIAAVGGMLTWAVYLLMGLFFGSDPIRYLFASLFVTIYAEVFARVKKTPTTSYLVPGLIPLIPGGALYNTMKFALNNAWSDFGEAAAYTIQLALALSAGIIVVSSVMRMASAVYRFAQSRRKRKKKS